MRPFLPILGAVCVLSGLFLACDRNDIWADLDSSLANGKLPPAVTGYSPNSANASATPYRLYKHFAHEGGSNTPFIAHWPARIRPGRDWCREPAQLIDIMATVVDVTGATYTFSTVLRPKRPCGFMISTRINIINVMISL